MRRPPSALKSIGGFGVAVAVLSVTATAAVIVLAPEPIQKRMTAAEAVAALRDNSTVLDRTLGAPPDGTRARLIEGLIATEFDRPVDDVRVVWPEGNYEKFTSRTIRIGRNQLKDEQISASHPTLLLRGADGKFESVPSEKADGLMQLSLLNIPFPAFTASVRQSDGRWLTVAPLQPFLTGWQRNVLIALAVSLLLLAPLAWVFARRLTRPFRALSGALGDTAGPIPLKGPRELREAATAIATMRTKLMGEAAERARILTAIAHDLRTPLTGLRLRVENVEEPQRARMVEDIERMQSMIGEVLGFARDAAVPVERFNVGSFVGEIVADMGNAASSITVLADDDAAIAVPRPAFRRVVENLLRNAIDYAGGGRIGIRRDRDDVIITVSDDGPGIAPSDRERLLQPFERGETSRNRETGGTGLGFSIVRDFATRYHGDFSLHDAAGGGTVAKLRLPTI